MAPKPQATATTIAKDLSDLSGRDKHECAACGNMKATAHCTGCHRAPNMDGSPRKSVQYCSKECQKAHWPDHRKDCKNLQARKALFRAAELLQKVWYTVRRESYDSCVVRVEEIGGDLVVFEGDYMVEPTMRKGGFYRKFPEHIFKKKEDAEAGLSLLFCNDALSHMFEIIFWLLEGLGAKTTETMVKVVNPARRARYASDGWDHDWFHHVLEVALVSGETYAIDLTGAQYGQYKAIVHWPEYMKRCVKVFRVGGLRVRGSDPLGTQARTMLAMTFSDPADDRTEAQRAIPVLGECLKLQFNQALVDVQKRYVSGSKLLRLSQADFEEAEKDILSMAQQVTRETAEKADVLYPLILGEASQANQMLLEKPEMAKGQLLAYHLVKLAAAFNGAWKRDGETGSLVSLSLERRRVDDEYAEQVEAGSLAEQKCWSDMTRRYYADLADLKKMIRD